MSLFICPYCGKKLKKEENRYLCEEGHSFDRAKEGYVHLLPVSKMHSKIPGDTKEMVMARHRFLESGLYDIFSDKLNETVLRYASDNMTLVDAGCGEGYYTKRLSDFLSDFYNLTVCGFDISKFAVRYASKNDRKNEYAVASIFNIPLEDECADIIVDVFAPIVEKEFFRILKSGGYLIIAVPSENHLFGLKEIAYEKPYKNEVKSTEYEGFEFIERIPVRGVINTENHGVISDLFNMTPYYLKTGTEGKERIEGCQKLVTEIGFDFLVYRKD